MYKKDKTQWENKVKKCWRKMQKKEADTEDKGGQTAPGLYDLKRSETRVWLGEIRRQITKKQTEENCGGRKKSTDKVGGAAVEKNEGEKRVTKSENILDLQSKFCQWCIIRTRKSKINTNVKTAKYWLSENINLLLSLHKPSCSSLMESVCMSLIPSRRW